MNVQPVLTETIHQVWPMVEKMVSSALKYSKGDFSVEHAKVYLADGSWKMFVAVDDTGDIQGACTIQFINRPNDRVAFLTAIGGKMITDPDTFGRFCDLLRMNGATKMEGAVRPSMQRFTKKLGFAPKYSIVEATL